VTPTTLVIDSLPVYQYTQAEAELWGGEALLEGDIGNGLIARGRIEAVRGTNLAAHEPLPLMPPLRGSVALSLRDRLGVEVEGYAKQTRLNPLDVPTAGYGLLNLFGGGDVRALGRPWRIDVTLHNALNKRYRSFLSRYKEFADDPGRNLTFRLSTGFVD
ncbi:MAG TPA: TonB-dependent receptor, partial [Gemmatimonadales bacterium]|nr:TonB-dependent receptor [Gemmatimonadales bacterium]